MSESQIVAEGETPAAEAIAPAAANAAPTAEATPPVAEANAPAAEIAAPAATNEIPAQVTLLPEATLLAVEPAPRVEIPPIDLPKEPSIQPTDIKVEDVNAATLAAPAATAKPGIRQYALLAASLALAAVVGALAGAAAIGLTSPAPAVQSTAANETFALKASVAQLSRDVAGLKHGVDAIGRSTASQFKTFAERFDRVEKAQVEPAAKLAKISESLDRLERRVAASTHDVTGAVTTVEKHQAKPHAIEGWKLVDIYAGRVVLASRTGELYSVGPGSNLPGVGRVESIKREDGRVIVSTPKGIITAAIQPQQLQSRRPAPYYGPYRY